MSGALHLARSIALTEKLYTCYNLAGIHTDDHVLSSCDTGFEGIIYSLLVDWVWR